MPADRQLRAQSSGCRRAQASGMYAAPFTRGVRRTQCSLELACRRWHVRKHPPSLGSRRRLRGWRHPTGMQCNHSPCHPKHSSARWGCHRPCSRPRPCFCRTACQNPRRRPLGRPLHGNRRPSVIYWRRASRNGNAVRRYRPPRCVRQEFASSAAVAAELACHLAVATAAAAVSPSTILARVRRSCG